MRNFSRQERCRIPLVSMTTACALAALLSNMPSEMQAAEKRKTPTDSAAPSHEKSAATTEKTTAPSGQMEHIRVVRSTIRSSNGVTGTALGGGLMTRQHEARSVQTISRDYISKQAPTQNPITLMSMNPGANVVSADPYGLSMSQIRIRGLDSSEIGWLFEGMPRNNSATNLMFGNEVADAENLQSLVTQPGSANYDTPTMSASGGMSQIFMIDPSHHRGGYVDFAYGTYKTNREFIRLETGDIGRTGVRAWLSFSHTDSDSWRGSGDNERQHLDFKLVKDFHNNSRIALAVAYDNQVIQNLLFPTKAQFDKLGASANYSSTYTPGSTSYYKQHLLPYNDVIVSAPSVWNIDTAGHFRIDETPYFFYGWGPVDGAVNLNLNNPVYSGTQKVFINKVTSGFSQDATTGVASTAQVSQMFRPGSVTKFTWKQGHNTLSAGFWYEWMSNHSLGSVTRMDQTTGVPANMWGNSYYLNTTGGQRLYTRNTMTYSQTYMMFIGDTLKLLKDRLTLSAGFKYTYLNRDGYNYLEQGNQRKHVLYQVPTPYFSAHYNIDSHQQIYVAGSTNFHVPSDSNMYNLYNLTSGTLSTGISSQKSEYSIEEELGYRYQNHIFAADVSFFNYNFTNRQLALPVWQNDTLVSENVNAGGQTSRGVDVQIGMAPFHHFRPYVSFEYLYARMDNNLAYGTTVLNTKGKTAIGSPHYQGALGIDYDDGRIFGNLNLRYTGRQYSTFMDDESIPGYITDNITLGYRFPKLAFLKVPQLQVNLQNLTNSMYRTGIYTFTPSAKISAPTYYINPGFAALFTFSSSF